MTKSQDGQEIGNCLRPSPRACTRSAEQHRPERPTREHACAEWRVISEMTRRVLLVPSSPCPRLPRGNRYPTSAIIGARKRSRFGGRPFLGTVERANSRRSETQPLSNRPDLTQDHLDRASAQMDRAIPGGLFTDHESLIAHRWADLARPGCSPRPGRCRSEQKPGERIWSQVNWSPLSEARRAYSSGPESAI